MTFKLKIVEPVNQRIDQVYQLFWDDKPLTVLTATTVASASTATASTADPNITNCCLAKQHWDLSLLTDVDKHWLMTTGGKKVVADNEFVAATNDGSQASFCVVHTTSTDANFNCAYVFDHQRLLFSFNGSAASREDSHLMRFLHYNDKVYLLARTGYGTLSLYDLTSSTSDYLVNSWTTDCYLTGIHLVTVSVADDDSVVTNDSQQSTTTTYMVVTGWVWHPVNVCYHFPLEKLFTSAPAQQLTVHDDDNLFALRHRHDIGDADETGDNGIGISMEWIELLKDHTGLALTLNGSRRCFTWPMLDRYQWPNICRFMTSQSVIAIRDGPFDIDGSLPYS